jgi:arylsulfatase A-like enzyme
MIGSKPSRVGQRGATHSPVSRRTFLKTTALATATGLASPSVSWAAPAIAGKRPPNLLFINVDQLSLNALPQFGCQHLQTPNLDRLARRGTSFQLSHCADPLCSPSRACWFTGRAPTEHGVVYNDNGFRLRPETPDLGAWLRNVGYETFYTGKWHVPGREVNDSFHVFHEACPVGDHSDAAISRVCETFLRKRSPGAPFFLAAGLMNPHDICGWIGLNSKPLEQFPYPAIEKELPPLPPNYNYDTREPEFFISRVRHGEAHFSGKWSETIWRYYAWSYYRQVEMVDASVGRILDALENSPHADNTMILFTSDHGDAIGSHQLFAKLSLYNNALCVPMIVSYPGHVAENHVDRTHLVSGFDVTPTLCDYAGTAPPPDQRGLSLRPAIEGHNTPWRDYVVAHNFILGRMVRSAQYKYIAYQGDKTEQLFDLQSDPWETKNLAAETTAAGPLADHRRLLAEWESPLKPAAEPPGGWLKQLEPRAQTKPKAKK